jgi:hypothetical protein
MCVLSSASLCLCKYVAALVIQEPTFERIFDLRDHVIRLVGAEVARQPYKVTTVLSALSVVGSTPTPDNFFFMLLCFVCLCPRFFPHTRLHSAIFLFPPHSTVSIVPRTGVVHPVHFLLNV